LTSRVRILLPVYRQIRRLLTAYCGVRFTFRSIEIDVYSRCNRRCAYCPNSVHNQVPHKMESDIFQKIIDELEAMEFNGTIALHRYGEPLLDARLDDFITRIKVKVPQSKVHINSNGDLLNYRRFKMLLEAGVDYFAITSHDDTLGESLKELDEQAAAEERKKYRIVPSRHLMLHSRAGAVDLENIPTLAGRRSAKQSDSCYSFCSTIVINSYGRAVFCCNDYFSEAVLGDLREKTLLEIWRGKEYMSYRKALARGARSRFKLCSNCEM